MIEVIQASDRGNTRTGWLDSKHSFSFGHYHNPKRLGFGVLRVINDDVIAPGSGFGKHPHSNMEIVTYVVEGGLKHEDSLGNGSVIRAGDVQRMTAGSGILHSEFNASQAESCRFLQIWIIPERENIEPGYEQKSFSEDERNNTLHLLISRDGEEGSLHIHQDIKLYGALLESGKSVEHKFHEGRKGWLQIVRGELRLNDEETLVQGDGVALINEPTIHLQANTDTEFLVFDLP